MLNAVVTSSSVDVDGGKSRYGNAGAGYGISYCDVQCRYDFLQD